MRGVHVAGEKVTPALPGSSPHARGPPVGSSRGAGAGRIIPACAGSTRLYGV